ncbi:MAG: FAD-dependent oxidoreductase [Bacilli bacterium]|jgi:thioredoxin reductase (NADPH)|nr:FAD-dependent oxidoreductase [Bacilli bacterium]
MKLNFDVVVIGAGPAGMTAAIYLKRAEVNVAMIDCLAPGGQMNRALKIDNYPGFTTIDGPTLALNMFQQTQELGIPYQYGQVVKIDIDNDKKIVKLSNGKEIIGNNIIVATGRKPKELGLKMEKKLIGRGISYCVYCDGLLFKGKDVIVVGTGDTVIEEAKYLDQIANKVTIIDYNNKKKYNNLTPNLDVIHNCEIIDIYEENNKLSGVKIKDKKTTKTKIIKAEGLFINIGFTPISDFINDIGIKTIKGYIIVNKKMRTNVEGIYACGDVIKKELYQVSTAVGEGAKTAYQVIQDLKQ